ncbi:MAG: hypothetical protein U9Q61_05210, partial [Thermodesulfobacteriota bacterium]|nr:hypothetical protein [Thermodesulfobacteriota bacterium]
IKMSLQSIAQNQPQVQGQGVTPDQDRAMKNAMLLEKLQQMPADQRQMVIALAQKKRREREGQLAQRQQQRLPQQPAQRQQPVQRPLQQPVQRPVQRQPQQRPVQRQPQQRVSPEGFKQLARSQQNPSLAQMLQQRPRVGMGG